MYGLRENRIGVSGKYIGKFRVYPRRCYFRGSGALVVVPAVSVILVGREDETGGPFLRILEERRLPRLKGRLCATVSFLMLVNIVSGCL